MGHRASYGEELGYVPRTSCPKTQPPLPVVSAHGHFHGHLHEQSMGLITGPTATTGGSRPGFCLFPPLETLPILQGPDQTPRPQHTQTHTPRSPQSRVMLFPCDSSPLSMATWRTSPPLQASAPRPHVGIKPARGHQASRLRLPS